MFWNSKHETWSTIIDVLSPQEQAEVQLQGQLHVVQIPIDNVSNGKTGEQQNYEHHAFIT